MNRIYKVIYSKVRQCYVVVSELAKNQGKKARSEHTMRGNNRSYRLAAIVALTIGAGSLLYPMQVEAWTDDSTNNYFTAYDKTYFDQNGKRSENWKDVEPSNTNQDKNRVGAKDTGAIAAGMFAQAGLQTVTIGNRNAGASKGSVYVGEYTGYNTPTDKLPQNLKSTYVTSVGFMSNATWTGTVAIGANASAEGEKNNVILGEGDLSKVLSENQGIKGASVALGYSATARAGNIAIGAYSDASTDLRTDKSDTAKSYLTKKTANSYVSVGKSDALRRISNVADGASASDVATVGQLQELAKKAGVYKAGFGIEITPDTTTKENTIKLSRNLGRDMDPTDKATLVADESRSALVLGGRVEEGQSKKGQVVEKPYGAFGQDSVVVGGANNIADKDGAAAVVIGGTTNTASAQYSTVAGGNNNDAFGNESSVFGGFDNDAFGAHATLSGGSMNKAHGEAASVFGGAMNSALGDSSVAVGGLQSTVNGAFAVGIAGGSTNANHALAAGNGANVTVENGTAIGYQATTNKAGTIAFGHDVGDVSGYAVTWKKRTDGKTNADHTTNDYTQVPDSVTPTTYKDAYYNRLVKVADGQDAHDVVVMEQLTKATSDLTKDLSVNAGWGINVNDVTTQNDDGTETTTKNVISLNRNLGTNYGNLGWGEGKVTFEASGQNSLILGGAASVSEYDHHSDVKAGVYGKDSVLVGGFNNLIGEKGETSVIVGGRENQVTNQKSVIVGGFWNKVTGSTSVVVGGMSNEASGSGDGVFGGFRNKVSGGESVVLGGQTNEVTGMNSVVSGGTDNNVSGHYASANGGKKNTISGNYAATLGGFNNQSTGMFSNAIGGDNNITSGQYSITSGGSGNTASGDNSYIGGGGSNQAAGVGASVFGGYRSKVNGNLSTGVGGGSTNNRATAALAAGYQSMVTDGGVAYRSLTSEEKSKIYKGQQYWPGFSGFLVDNDTKVLDRISTAIGYQATADAPGVISFGHDKGDESSENGRYSSAYYNRLVKAADGIEDHDAVVMEQLKNASNVGQNIKVYKTDKNGNVQFDKSNNPIEDTSDSDDVKTRREAAQKASEDAWGKAIGTGKIADPTKSDTNDPEANGSQQLVTGGTVYNEVRPSKDGKYVKIAQTTGANLIALDDQVKQNAQNISNNTYTQGDGILMDKTKKTISVNKGDGLKFTEDHKLAVNTGKHLSVNTSGQIDVGDNGTVAENDGNLVTGDTVYKALNGGMTEIIIGTPGKNGKDGTPGTIGLVGPAGTNGKDGAVDITIQNGEDGEDGKDGIKGANGVDGKDGINRIVYEDKNGKHQVATMEDGLKFAGDDGQKDATKAIAKKLNNTVDIIGGADSTKLTANNIGVNNVEGKLKIQLAKNLAGITSIANQTTTGEGDAQTTTGAKIDLKNDGSISVNSGKITDVKSGLTATDGTYADTDKNNAANIGDIHSMIEKEAGNTDDKLALKANVAADNIGIHITDTTAQKTNLDNWGAAIGTGKIADPDASDKETNGSKQLVTGGTVYNEVRPSKDGKYVKIAQTTGANLIALDDQVKQNAQNISDNTYAQGDGILMDKTKKTISVNKGDGLKFTEDHKLAVYTGNGLKIDNGAVAIKTSDSNLKVDSNGIGLSDKITIGSDKTKQVTIDGTKGEISGLTNTTWDSKADYSKSTKAATESQVDAAVKDAVKQAGENDIHVAAGSYAVNDQNQVSMNLVDKNNDTKGTVIITDVAKSSEMGDVSKLADGVKNAGGKTTTVVDAINNVNTSMNTKIGDQNYSTSNTSGSNKYVQDGDSITSAIGKLDGAVQQATTAAGQHSTVSAGSNITVTPAKQTDGHTDYQVALNKDITVDSVTAETATTDTLTVNNSATIGGVTIANKTISGLDDTKIEKGSTNAVNAGTIYNELRPTNNGSYIQTTNTTAQNLVSLDTQVKKTSDLINSDGKTIKIGGSDAATKIDVNDKDGKGRVITGVVSDAKDMSSAANVGYVNGITAASNEQIYRDMNMQYNHVENDISRAAAGSNALAALHPMQEFDPDDKAQFALGYGHYRNSNAGAVGAFYQPDENSLFSFGVSFGNGDAGLNAGVTFKFGPGGSDHHALTKTQMAKVIDAQSKEIDELKKDNADKDKRIDALEQKMTEILAKLDSSKS